jgi:hypothetical protein
MGGILLGSRPKFVSFFCGFLLVFGRFLRLGWRGWGWFSSLYFVLGGLYLLVVINMGSPLLSVYSFTLAGGVRVPLFLRFALSISFTTP